MIILRKVIEYEMKNLKIEKLFHSVLVNWPNFATEFNLVIIQNKSNFMIENKISLQNSIYFQNKTNYSNLI